MGHDETHLKRLIRRSLLTAAAALTLSCARTGPRGESTITDASFRASIWAASNVLALVPNKDDLLLASAAGYVNDAFDASAFPNIPSDGVYEPPSATSVHDSPQEANALCYLNRPVLSKFSHPLSIGVSSITAIDIITNKTLVVEFRTSAPLCQGYEEATERHFYLRQAQYEPMLDAIDDGKTILIKGIESPEDKFIQVSWGAQ